MDFFKDNQYWMFIIIIVSAILFYIADKKRKDLKSVRAFAESFVAVANKLEKRHKRLLYALMKSVSDMKYLFNRFSIIGDSEADTFLNFSGDVLKCVNNKDISESQKINQVIYYLDSDYKPLYDQYLEKYLNEFDNGNNTK
jgi:hypothetical protein